MSFETTVLTELEKGRDDSLVKYRTGQGGRQVPYMEGHAVIQQANRIFGYDGWSYRVIEGPTHRKVELISQDTGLVKEKELYLAVVQVIVGEVEREDIGLGEVNGATMAAHETAMKGAVTDALKRALRSFGPQFGNDLYDKANRPSSSNMSSISGDDRGPAREKPEAPSPDLLPDELPAKCPVHAVSWMSGSEIVFHLIKGKRFMPSQCYKEALGLTDAAMKVWIKDNSQDLTGTSKEIGEKLLARVHGMWEGEHGEG